MSLHATDLVAYTNLPPLPILMSIKGARRLLPLLPRNTHCMLRPMYVRKTTHCLEGQHQDVDRTPRGSQSE